MSAFLSLVAVFAVLSVSSPAPALDGTASLDTLLRSGGNARGLGCDTCRVAVSALQRLFTVNASVQEIEKVLVKYCLDQKIEDDNVCHLVVPEFKVTYSWAKSACGVNRGSREERRGESGRDNHG